MIAVGFAILARIMGSVTDGGAVAGAIVAFILMLAGGYAGFVALLTLFALTVISTRWGYRRKQRMGVAERSKGRTGVASCCKPWRCGGLRRAGNRGFQR